MLVSAGECWGALKASINVLLIRMNVTDTIDESDNQICSVAEKKRQYDDWGGVLFMIEYRKRRGYVRVMRVSCKWVVGDSMI